MKIQTIQTFVLTYEVPDIEADRFYAALDEQNFDVLDNYEVDQEFISEHRIPS